MSGSVDICICTYRRPHIAETLRSLGQLHLPKPIDVAVIVADNDIEPSARMQVTEAVGRLPFPITYLHAPAGNISVARNACLDASEADFVAFIDDDETVTPEWLTRLIEAAETSGADAVLGPVRAKYSKDAPIWMQRGDFHSTFPVFVGDAIKTGYTCNVLMRRTSRHIAGRRFDLRRGKTGGEDTTFFSEVERSGGAIRYAAEAWVEEMVPESRATFRWLARRRFRVGQTHGRLLAEANGRATLAKDVVLASAKIVYCAAVTVLSIAMPTRRNRSILRGIMHAGVVSGRVGQAELELY